MRTSVRALALLAFAICWFLPLAGRAEDANKLVALYRSLNFQPGTVNLVDNKVSLSLGNGYRYLSPSDTVILLTKIFQNPPSAIEGNVGMIVPASFNPTKSWFALLTYSNDGHVPDNDAASINYEDLLKQIKQQATDDSVERRKQGFAGYEIIGWAQKPYYDSVNKKLYWAKSARFDGTSDLTLNYDVRILGREGYVNIKIVGAMSQLAEINRAMPSFLSVINFTPGNTYADFKPETDHTAAYGIAGLIAGGVLAKAGFFKALLAIIAGFGKAIWAAVIGFFAAIGGFFRNLYRRLMKR